MTPLEALTITRSAVLEQHKWDQAAATPGRRGLQERELEALAVLERFVGIDCDKSAAGSSNGLTR